MIKLRLFLLNMSKLGDIISISNLRYSLRLLVVNSELLNVIPH